MFFKNEINCKTTVKLFLGLNCMTCYKRFEYQLSGAKSLKSEI